jgi:phosphoserine phosphatase RsbU/P
LIKKRFLCYDGVNTREFREGSNLVQDGKQTENSVVRILDVLRTGDRLSTGEKGVRRYTLTGLEVAVSAVPAGTMGGDFHGIIHLDHGCTAVFIGDIAGHDFSSSILATSVLKYIEENREDLIHPNLFLRAMNRDLYRGLSSVARFFTAAICMIDIETNLLSYGSAGHPPGLIARADGDTVTAIGRKAMPLGFEREISFSLIQTEFMPGDQILLYTDGVSGARNRAKQEFGQTRLEELLRESCGDPVRAVGAIFKQHNIFASGGPETDDRTIVCAARVNKDAGRD